VQEAAGILIEILIRKGNLFDAERYAQVIYGNFRDKKNGIDQESEVVAMGAYNLALFIYKQKGNMIKAGGLARKSLRIRTLRYNSNHVKVGKCCDRLAGILAIQGKLGDEARVLHEHHLAISIRNHGPDGNNNANANYNLYLFYYRLALKGNTIDSRRTQLLLAKPHFVKVLRIFGPNHPNTVGVSSQLSEN
jgi:hypothetical protein